MKLNKTLKNVNAYTALNSSNIFYSNYTESIITEAFRIDLIDREARERIKNELAGLAGENIERYSGGFSSSLSADKGEEIIESILFVIDSLLISKASHSAAITLLIDTPLKKLYYDGIRLVRSYVFKSAGLLVKVKKLRINMQNAAYNETIDKKIRVILSHYDVFYGAHTLPGTPPYKTAIMPNKLRGILFLLRYLQNLYCENVFCLKFLPDEIDKIDEATGYEGNIFLPALSSAIAAHIGQGDIYDFEVDLAVRNKASSEIKRLSEHERKSKIIDAAMDINPSESTFVREYIRKCAEKYSKQISEAIRRCEPESVSIHGK